MGYVLIGVGFALLGVCAFFISRVLKMIDEEDDFE